MKLSFSDVSRRRAINAAAILLILVLSACSRSRAADALPTLQPTAPPLAASQALAAQRLDAAPSRLPPDTDTPHPTTASGPTKTAVPGATATPTPSSTPTDTPTPAPTATPTHPLMIEVMRQQDYPGSELVFEQTLEDGSNYDRYVVSYMSEGNQIFAMLTVPWGEAPASSWPIVIFNHGYIPPDEYRTTERYVDYVDGFARSGYIVFKSDYRGHGSSEGEPSGGYGSPGYTIDVLNGLAAVQRLPQADPQRIGMWGHSMGGYITLRAMVVSGQIDAGVIWGGVVASYPDLFERWARRAGDGPTPTPDPTRTRGRWRTSMIETYGTPEENPAFWDAISANAYLADLSGPLQLHHSTTDASVPVEYSQRLYEQIVAADREVELFLYEGDNHNIYANFYTAMRRSVEFFDLHVKG